MKKLLLAALAAAALAVPSRAAYIGTIFQNPGDLHLSAGATFNSRFTFNGGNTQVALAYHDADPKDSLLPQRLLDLGVEPISYALSAGLGGTTGNFVVPFGLSANLTPTLLGPGLKALQSSGNKTAQGIASIISSPAGGVAFGPNWTARGMRDGTILPFNQWRFPPGWFVGALWHKKF
jgi:hypothetical protein